MASTMTIEEAYEKINGLEWTLDGVHGYLWVWRRHGMTEVAHHPSPRGRRTKKYKEERYRLGDDYTTTVSEDTEFMGRLFAHVEALAHK